MGTTLFCLIYLPHFLKGQADVKQGRILRIIEKINAYSYEKNKWLVGGILLITVICLFTSQKVGFNNDMMSLNYEPRHLQQSEETLLQLFDLSLIHIFHLSFQNECGDYPTETSYAVWQAVNE